MFWFIIILVLIIVIFIRIKQFKIKLPNVTLVTGGVKTGKSALSLHLALKQYKKNLRKWKFSFKKDEKPLFYSNINLKLPFEYKIIDVDFLKREKRINKKSVVFIDECSLLADSMLYKDKYINENLMLFNKLFGHMSWGGSLFYNTQSLSDCHYSIKRCLSGYLYIYKLVKFPFISLAKVRYMSYNADMESSSVNIIENGEEEDYRNIVIFNNLFKKYDCYCYSVFTDYLTNKFNNGSTNNLKTYKLVTLQSFESLKKFEIAQSSKSFDTSISVSDVEVVNEEKEDCTKCNTLCEIDNNCTNNILEQKGHFPFGHFFKKNKKKGDKR